MKRLKTSVMTVAVVLALIAFVAPSSAYSIYGGTVSECESGETTWTFDVTCEGGWTGDPYDISNFIVAWCNGGAVEEVKVDGVSTGWDYVTKYGITGIKIDYDVFKGRTASVEITLNGCYSLHQMVEWVIKADGIYPEGTVYGPVASNCCTEIPEFSTIAIPIASILGLLFFFNHRKRRKEE